MRRLQILLLGFMLAAVIVLASGWSLVQELRYNLRLEVTEQLQIEEYLLLSAEMSTLYAEYGRLAASDTPQDTAEIDSLRRRVDAFLLAIQTQIARRSAEDGTVGVTQTDMAPEPQSAELLDLTLEIERTLSDVERAEALISEGALDEAEAVLRTALDGRLEATLLPAIDAAVQRERAREEAALDALNTLILRAQVGVVGLAAALALAALGLWLGVVRPEREALSDIERQVERLRGGLDPIPAGHTSNPEFSAISDGIREAAAVRDAQMEKIAALSDELAARETALRGEHDDLRQVDQVRRDFLADVSHELRTPLTVLRGVAEVSLRAKTPDAEDLQSALARIVDEAGHVSRIVEDLFFIARSRAGGLDLRNDIIDLGDALSATAQQAIALTAEGDAAVDWDVPKFEILVEGDVGRLRQLFTILLDNALKYGGSRPRIEAHTRLQDDKVIVEVRDHGPGVPEDDLPYVFDRLYRGAASSRAVPSGSGLGLPMARTIVEGHGGAIALQNAADGGALVTVTLPVFDENAIEEEPT